MIGKNVADLVVLVPDLDMQETVNALLNRPMSVGIRRISFHVERHPQRDAGCRSDAEERLRGYIRDFAYAIVMFDMHGSGATGTREEIQAEVENRLARNGWRERSKVVVIEPELESWIWVESPHVPQVLGLGQSYTSLRSWLISEGLWEHGSRKPLHPKEAMTAVLARTGGARSATLFRKIAKNVTVRHCSDPAFAELRTTLQQWFPRRQPPT